MKRTTLLLVMIIITTLCSQSFGQDKTNEMSRHIMHTSEKPSYIVSDGMLALATTAKDTIFLVKSETAQLIMTIWESPEYDGQRPIFKYISLEEMRILRDHQPRFVKKN